MSEFIEFTPEFLQTPQGVAELNRILQLVGSNLPGDTEAVRVFQGYGSPEGVISASVGAIYLRLDGSTYSTVYIKETGVAGTGWVATVNSGFISIGTIHQGDILYDNGTAWTRLTPGTSGYFLKSQGAGANPIWADLGIPVEIDEFNAGTEVIGTAATARVHTSTSATYTKIKELTPIAKGGVVNIAWQHKVNEGTCYTKLYINDLPVGTEQAISNTAYESESEANVTVKAGDIIQIYAKNPSSWVYAQQLVVTVSNPFIMVEASGY